MELQETLITPPVWPCSGARLLQLRGIAGPLPAKGASEDSIITCPCIKECERMQALLLSPLQQTVCIE